MMNIKMGVKQSEAYMSCVDYLDYWLNNYCKVNLKYKTKEVYSVIVNKYLIEICRRYDYSYGYLNNFVKGIKCLFRVTNDILGFINYNQVITISLPHT